MMRRTPRMAWSLLRGTFFVACAIFCLASQARATTDTVGGSNNTFSDASSYVRLVPITASASGTLQTVGLNLSSASLHIQTVIYADNSGAPGSLLGVSASTSASIGWNDLSIPGSISITSGTHYWIGWTSDNNETIYYPNSAVTQYYVANGSYGSTPPNCCTGWSTANSNPANFNARMTYTGATATPTYTAPPTYTPTQTPAPTYTATPTPTPTPTPGEPVLADVCPTPGTTTIFVCNSATNAPAGWTCPGSDSNNCTSESTPCLTFNHALSLAGADDVVTVGPGTYTETAQYAASGHSGHWVIAQCADWAIFQTPNGTPPLMVSPITCKIAQTVQSSTYPTNQAADIDLNGQDYTETIGFEIYGGYNGITTSVSPPGAISHHHCALYNYVHAQGSNGIGLSCSDYDTVYGNLVADTSKYGENCCSGITLYDPQAADSGAGFHDWVSHNVSHDNANTYASCQNGDGFILDNWNNNQDFCGNTTNYKQPALVDANLAYSNGGNGFIVYEDSTGGLEVVRDNTAYLDQTWNNLFQQGEFSCQQCDGTAFWANDIGVASKQIQSGNTAYDFGGSGTENSSYSLSFCYDSSGNPLTGTACGLPTGTGNQQGVDPLFVNPSGGDFHLQAASPAIGAGTSSIFGVPTTYLDSVTPPSPIDLGPLGATPSPTPTPTPTPAPAGFIFLP